MFEHIQGITSQSSRKIFSNCTNKNLWQTDRTNWCV